MKVGVIGGFQIGKSTLVNCLLDDRVAKTGGLGLTVTALPTRYTYGNIQNVEYWSKGRIVSKCRLHQFLNDDKISSEIDEVVVTLWKPLLKHIDLIDTPGFKSNDKDTTTTNNAIHNLDFVIVLLNNRGLDNLEIGVFSYLHQLQKPFMVIVNCMNTGGGVLWDPNSEVNKPIVNDIENRIKSLGGRTLPINGKDIWTCNLIWHWFASEHYLNDTPQQTKYIESQTEFYMKNLLKIQDSDYKSIAEKSNFGVIRALFEDESQWGFPLNFFRWNSQLNQELSNWQTNINNILNKL